MNLFTLLFLAALLGGLALELWLLGRQHRHVAAHRHAVPEAFRDKVSLAEHQKAADYTLARGAVSRWELPYGALILLVWLFGGGVDGMANWWGQWGLDHRWAGVGLLLSVLLFGSLLELPFALFRTFGVEARFGFNRTTPARFLGDLLLGTTLTVLLGGALAWVILWLLEGLGAWWWLAGWGVWLAFTLLLTWAFPTLIAPLFNKFSPLQDAALLQRIQGLLGRCGFHSDGVFVMDGSRRSSHGNAYFTGLGRAKRIVFFDTLLATLEPAETEAVLAHELGHYRRHHVRDGLILMAVLGLLGFALVGWLLGQPWFYAGLGSAPGTPAHDLLLMLLVLPVFSQFLQPLLARYQRRHEFEADDFAAAHCGAAPMIRALVKLYRENAATLTPDPLYSAFHHSHPPAPVRIAHLARSTPGSDT
jgi:STE24 endopeptidase